MLTSLRLLWLSLPFAMLSSGLYAQAKTVAAKPAAKPAAVPSLHRLMNGTGFRYEVLGDSVCSVPFSGTTLKNYMVRVVQVPELYVLFVNLHREAKEQEAPFTWDAAARDAVLRYNMYADIVKVGLDEESNTLVVRADAWTDMVNAGVLKRLIQQVGEAANQMYAILTKQEQ